MKLSEIWEKADKELEQIFGHLGNRNTKRVCAYGAILYYDAKDKTIDDFNNSIPLTPQGIASACEQDNILNDILKFEFAIGMPIWDRNDGNGRVERRWTFKQFAEKAKELGL